MPQSRQMGPEGGPTMENQYAYKWLNYGTYRSNQSSIAQLLSYSRGTASFSKGLNWGLLSIVCTYAPSSCTTFF